MCVLYACRVLPLHNHDEPRHRARALPQKKKEKKGKRKEKENDAAFRKPKSKGSQYVRYSSGVEAASKINTDGYHCFGNQTESPEPKRRKEKKDKEKQKEKKNSVLVYATKTSLPFLIFSNVMSNTCVTQTSS